MTISLKQVYQAVEEACETYTSYYDTKTGQTVHLPDAFLTGERNEELEELLENEPERFLQFPTQYDIHEYRIMRQFIYSLPEGIERMELQSAIRGKGAFRRFRATARHYGLEQQWYSFRDDALRQIALDWCRENNIIPLEAED